MNLGRRMFRGSLWCALDGWATEAANLAIFLVLVGLLGPADFGIVALAAVFTTIAVDLCGYSVSQVLIQRREGSPAFCDTVFWLVLCLAGVAAILCAAAAPALARLFDAPLLEPLLRWLCLPLILHALAAVPLSLLTRELRFDAVAKRSLAMIGAGGVVGVAMALAGFGPYAMVGQALAQGAVSALVLYGASGWRPRGGGDWGALREIAGYAAGVAGNRVVGLLDERAPQLVIGLVLGPAAVGHFNLAMRLVDILIRMFVVPLNQVALPAIARVQADPAQVRGILATGIAAATLVSCPAFLGTAIVAPVLLPVALGPAWLPAAPVLQLLTVRGIVWPTLLYGTSLLYGTGRPGRLLAINALDLVLGSAALVLAAPFGLPAMAAAWGLRVLLVRWPLVGAEIGRLTGLGLPRQARLIAPALAAAALMTAVLLVLRESLAPSLSGWPLLAVLAGLGALLYPLFVVAVNPAITRPVLMLLGGLRRPRQLLATATVKG